MHSLAPQQSYGRDLETAHKQAVAAASFAFERASERALAAQGLQESNIGPVASIDEQVDMGQHLGRKQSIRFTGLTAVPIHNRSITRRVAPQSDDTSTLPNGAQNKSHLTGGYFSGQRVPGARSSPRDKGNQYESHISSSSSSLRKLKRARSMFTLRGSTTNLFGDTRPPKNSDVQQKAASSRNEPSKLSDVIDSRLQRSFSFLRGDKHDMASGLDRQTNQSEVAQLAREQYLRELEEKSIKHNSSPLASSQNDKSQRAFRKSVRSSSTNSHGSAIASPAQAPKRGLGYKARSLSFSLKQKMKQVFQRPSVSKEELPIQQLEASRLHFGESTSIYAAGIKQYHQIPSPDIEILRKASSRESSLGKLPGFPESASPVKNIGSVGGEDGASPLFQSWANPTPENTLAAIQSREKKRLSVIQEHGGPHQSSSSCDNYADLGNVFHAPIRSSNTGEKIEEFVDSHNVYSALQQKIDGKRRLPQSKEIFWEKEEIGDDMEANIFQPRRHSLSTQPLTSSPVTGHSPDHSIETSNLVMVQPMISSSLKSDIHPTQDRSNDYSVQEEFLQMYSSITAQQLAVQKEINDDHTKRPLREIKATFFPSSMRIERTNVSPYRRLMSSVGNSETGADSELEENTPIGVRSESAFGSASIYSRTSSGNTPKDDKSSASLSKSETSHEDEKSVVITTLQTPHEEALTPIALQIILPKQAKELQGWIDPELSQPGNRGLGDIQNLSAAGKENRRKMECSQTDDIDVRGLRDDVHMKKQGFEIPLENAIVQQGLRNHASGSMFSRSPLLEIGQSATLGGSKYSSFSSPRQPSTPCKSLYRDQEMPSLRRNYQESEVRGRTASNRTPKSQGSNPLGNLDGDVLRHGPSNSNENIRIDTTQDMCGTPTPAPTRAVFRTNKAAKSQGYNSPDRLARIRRLQSSNSLASHNKRQVETYEGEHERGKDSKEHAGPAFQTPPMIGGASNQHVSSTALKEAHSAGVRRMADSFLSARQRYAEVNEDNGIGSAFL